MHLNASLTHPQKYSQPFCASTRLPLDNAADSPKANISCELWGITHGSVAPWAALLCCSLVETHDCMKRITSGEPDRLTYQQKGGRDVLRGRLGEDKRQMNRRTDVGGHHRLDMTGLPGWILKGRPASLCTEGIIHVQSNKVWCIITVQFSSWTEIESFRTGTRAAREREGGR